VTSRTRWFDRTFAFDAALSAYPSLIERLRGTPARLEDRVRGLVPAVLTARVDDAWSIQENVGHLLDLEPLWALRLDDFERGAERLRPADLDNRRTHDADHNARAIEEILRAFRTERGAFVERLERYDEELIGRSSLHPRLAQPMRVIDHALFVAEHDDHHLATIADLLRRNPGGRPDPAARLTNATDWRGEPPSSPPRR
jgi:uncharacterized damage-inducible protein DinB